MPTDPLIALAKARRNLAAAVESTQAVLVEHRLAQEKVTLIQGQGVGAPKVRAAVDAQKKVAAQIEAATKHEQELREAIEALRKQVRLRTPERSVQQLDGHVPVALFPVRLETRFGNRNTELKIRVYPEQIHINTHEPELTASERDLGQTYWKARWVATTPEDTAAAWTELTRSLRPNRARWIAKVSEPTNVAKLGTGNPVFGEVALRAGPFTRQPTAKLLPEQWVAVGLRGGAEVFRVWGSPVREGLAVSLAPDPTAPTETTTDVPDTQDTLPIDDSITWLFDYEAALAAGMAITVTDADVQRGNLAAGVDELVVLGVDWGATPEVAATSIEAHLASHSYSDGLALLGAGVPTNNTDEERAGAGTDPHLDRAALDPATVAAAPSAAARIGTALGIRSETAFDAIPAVGSLADGASADMNNALWAATFGSYLDQFMEPIVSSRTADEVRDHFRRYVRGRGPYAALRVGRQPYGLLPVTAGRTDTGNAFLDAMSVRVAGLRPFWDNASGEVPRLGDSDRPDLDVVELLRRTPRCSSFRFREVLDGSVSSSATGFFSASVFQELVANLTLALAGISGRPRITGVTVDPHHRAVPVPLVKYGDLSESDLLDPDYIKDVLSSTSVSGGFRRLLNDPAKANTLLEALLRHAAAAEYVIGSTLLVLDHELTTQVITKAPDHMRVREREVIGLEADMDRLTPDEPVSKIVSAQSPVELAETRIQAVSGGRSLVDFLAVTPNKDLRRWIPTRRFSEFRASLGRLAALPTAELDRLAADTIDCVSHRLDAWATSVATRRLDEIRTANVTGTHIGGFGYVENLHPSGSPVSRGYLHAPSIPHATTAAILRSAHLARGEKLEGTLAVDLSSSRVSHAIDLIDGVRRGQPIGALLGYRFERSLRQKDLTLAKYILPMRQRTPLAQVSTGPDLDVTVETIAARDVVDGVAMLDAWKADRAAYYASVPVANADRAKVDVLLTLLDDALDAVSDIFVAESVHQAVLGNAERSAAALDALDRQQTLPDPAVIRTPRTAIGHQHRVLLVFVDEGPAPGWTALTDARRAADPRIDTWCGQVLGAPGRFQFAAEVHDADGAVVQRLVVRLPELGLSAASVVAAGTASSADAASELEQRLAVAFGAKVTAAGAAELVLLDEKPPTAGMDVLGLRDLLDLANQASDLLASGRPADSRSLLPDTERPNAGFVIAELRGRADAAVANLNAAVTALEDLAPTAAPATVVTRLLAAADAGVPSAVPGDEDPHEQAARIAAAGRSALDRLVQDEADFVRAGTFDPEIVQHDLARIRGVFGEGFTVLPRFRLPGPVEAGAEDFRASLEASVGDPALLAGTSLAAADWLTMHATVRPAIARLTSVLEGSEMLLGRAGLADLMVAQLPRRPGEKWVGLPFDVPPPPTTSLVLHALNPIDFAQPLAAIVVDQWTEAVPSTMETTGVSFHFDAPGARAPQSVLIATPADRNAASWDVATLLGCVRDTMALARIRPLDIDDVDVAARFLPATYLPFNLESKVPSINLTAIIAQAIEINNVAFLEVD
ncbi:hypothetical protein [Kocuria kalidii]|uniref:hypothetical protein n=1 Tax=Kocuria kalidii TaxID=3376283 RepID=UPI0037BD9A79